MFAPQALNLDGITLCRKTMSSNTFYMIVLEALHKQAVAA